MTLHRYPLDIFALFHDSRLFLFLILKLAHIPLSRERQRTIE